MRIATWNVNSLAARLQHVLDWTAANPVDVLCVQELKLTEDKFPLVLLASGGYPHCAVFDQKTYNGVAIMSRQPLRDVVKNIVGFDDDRERCGDHQPHAAACPGFTTARAASRSAASSIVPTM